MLNSGNALMQHLSDQFSCFPVSPGSAEAQVIWGDIVKCLFIGNISAEKYQNPFTYVKVIASQRRKVFLRHGVVLNFRQHTNNECFGLITAAAAFTTAELGTRVTSLAHSDSRNSAVTVAAVIVAIVGGLVIILILVVVTTVRRRRLRRRRSSEDHHQHSRFHFRLCFIASFIFTCILCQEACCFQT